MQARGLECGPGLLAPRARARQGGMEKRQKLNHRTGFGMGSISLFLHRLG